MPVDLGPPIVGDPAGMRALAAFLGAQAQELGSLATAVTRTVAALRFEGPASVRFRARTADSARATLTEALGLQDLASALQRAAAQVEAEQAERARLEQQLAEQRVHAP